MYIRVLRVCTSTGTILPVVRYGTAVPVILSRAVATSRLETSFAVLSQAGSESTRDDQKKFPIRRLRMRIIRRLELLKSTVCICQIQDRSIAGWTADACHREPPIACWPIACWLSCERILLCYSAVASHQTTTWFHGRWQSGLSLPFQRFQ
jgi:hypothetical protein